MIWNLGRICDEFLIEPGNSLKVPVSENVDGRLEFVVNHIPTNFTNIQLGLVGYSFSSNSSIPTFAKFYSPSGLSPFPSVHLWFLF